MAVLKCTLGDKSKIVDKSLIQLPKVIEYLISMYDFYVHRNQNSSFSSFFSTFSGIFSMFVLILELLFTFLGVLNTNFHAFFQKIKLPANLVIC